MNKLGETGTGAPLRCASAQETQPPKETPPKREAVTAFEQPI